MISKFVLVTVAVYEYFDEFDCRTCPGSLAAELDFVPAGFTVVACQRLWSIVVMGKFGGLRQLQLELHIVGYSCMQA